MPKRRGIPAPLLAVAVLFAASFANVACRSFEKSSIAQAAGSAAAAPTWTTFQDPYEKAFTVEVPQGWAVKGGLFRMGYSDERPMIDLTSSDGKTNVRLGDVAIPSYTVPSPLHPTEGSIVDLGAQAQLVIAKYRTGPEFAVLYAHVRFYKTCANPTADTADVNFTIPDYLPDTSGGAAQASSQSSTGRIAYTCGSGASQNIAFAAVRTTLAGGIWGAPTLGSFIAPTGQLALARTVLLHCAQTFRLSPDWINYQKQMDAYALQYQQARQQQRLQQLAQQVQQFDAQMQAMRDQVNAFENQMSAQASQVQSFDNALVGITPTVDPLTGESSNVWTGSQSGYWADGMGNVVNSATAPAGGGWHQLQVTSQ
ncbi:MAG: hypothetical protein WB341_09150 [Terracidiphilus sp.]